MKVKAKYDFVANDASEFGFFCGDILFVKEDYENGWSLAGYDENNMGLIPSDYVEPIDQPEVGAPPPELYSAQFDDDWDSDEGAPKQQPSEFAAGSSASSITQAVQKGFGRSKLRPDEYLSRPDTPENVHPVIYLDFVDGLPHWRASANPITCQIGQHNKSSKCRGVKSFILFRITSSLIPSHVERRYKNFDWLSNELREKVPVFCPPALPAKKLTNAFDAEFLEVRSQGLQRYLDWCCLHPIISKLPIFHHFLSAVDKNSWKDGKRRYEGDKLKNYNFFFMVSSSDSGAVEESTSKSMSLMDENSSKLSRDLSGLLGAINGLQTKRATSTSKDFFELSEAITNLSSTLDTGVSSKKIVSDLVRLFVDLGKTLKSISSRQSATSEAVSSINTTINDYMAILSNLSIPLSVGQKVCATLEEAKRMRADGRMSEADFSRTRTGCRTMLHSVQAECNYVFSRFRMDMISQLGTYIRDQAAFYRQIADELEAAAQPLTH